MKITLVTTLSYSAQLRQDNCHSFFEEYPLPLGLLTVAGVLEKSGHEVRIVDLNLLDAGLNNSEMTLKERYQALAADIASVTVSWIGFTTMCDSFHHTLSIAGEVRSRTSTPIVLGGPHATAVDMQTLTAFECIDFVCRGEAEAIMAPLCAAFEGKIGFERVPGLTRRDDSGLILRNARAPLIEAFDDLPMPAFHHYEFLKGKIKYIPIEAGRGCPFKCNFCSTSLFFNRTYRLKSGERLLAEMGHSENVFGSPRMFRMIHDMLTVDRRLVTKMCESLRTVRSGVKWSCSARIDCVRPPLLEVMANAGCAEIYFGIESGSSDMQQKMKKKLRVADVLPRVQEAVQLGMTITCSFIAGFLDETREDLESTLAAILDLLLKHGSAISVQLHLLAPYVGTELYDQYCERLQYDDYLSDQAGQALPSESKRMIKSNPALFSNFYWAPLHHYPRELLFGIDTFVYVALPRYILTFSAMRMYGETALGLFELWQAEALRIRQAADIAAVVAEKEVIRSATINMVRSWCKDQKSDRQWLVSLINFEDGIYDGDVELANPCINVGKFSLAPGVRITQSTLDIEAVRKCLTQGYVQPGSIFFDRAYYAIKVEAHSNRVAILRISKFTFNVLQSIVAGIDLGAFIADMSISNATEDVALLGAKVNDAVASAIQFGLLRSRIGRADFAQA